MRRGSMAARQKGNGGVRGIVTGDSFRTRVAKAIAQQYGPELEEACSPFQFALSTRAGTEKNVQNVNASLCIEIVRGNGAANNKLALNLIAAIRTSEKYIITETESRNIYNFNHLNWFQR